MAFNTNTRQYRDAVQHAVDMTNEITPSVLALSIASGISAKKFADALVDAEATSMYRIEVSALLQTLLVGSAVEEAKEREEAEKSK
jgi:hypothetical protein